MGTNRTPRQIIRTDVDGTTPVHSGISGSSTSDTSAINGTRVGGTSAPTCVINGISAVSETSAAPPSGVLWSPRIDNIQQSTSPYFRKSDECNAAIDRKLSNYLISIPVSTQVFGD